MYDLFTSNFNTHDNRTVRRLILINAILIMGFFTFGFFCIFNCFVICDYYIGLINFIATVMTLLIFFDLRFNKDLERASYTTIAVFFIFLILFVTSNQNVSFGLIWTQFLPIVAVGLVGAKRGIVITLVYFVILFYLAYTGIGTWDYGTWDLISFFRLVFASLLMLFLITIFDIALERSHSMLEKLSVTDPLTTLYNRRKIIDTIQVEVARARRYSKPLSLILFDIDDFKQINDRFGHKSGDKVLVKLSATVQSALRSSDHIGRWGGEEFLIVCPETTAEEALIIAEKLRMMVNEIECEKVTNISCSFGVTEFDPVNDSVDNFIHRSDLAMYRAKDLGKNSVSR